MNKTESVILHLGFPKTATTTFQHTVFPSIPGIEYLGIPPDVFAEVTRKLIQQNDNEFDQNLPEVSREFWSLVKGDSQTLMVSEEKFLSAFNKWGIHDPVVTAKRLRQVIVFERPQVSVKVIFLIRSQPDLFLSYYAQDYRHGFSEYPMKDLLKEGLSDSKSHFLFRTFHFENIVNELNKEFGSENVRVFAFERFRRHRTEFFNDLGEYFGCDGAGLDLALGDQHLNKKKRSSDSYVITPREREPNLLYSALRAGEILWSALKLPSSRRVKNMYKRYEDASRRKRLSLRKADRIKILRHFEEENRRLDKTLSLGLGEYGYFNSKD
jgi:hypothetical protein